MKAFTRYYKRLRITRLKTAFFVILISGFLLPSFTKFERTGDNMFQIYLNGTNVGVVADYTEADDLLMEARKEIGQSHSDLVLTDAVLTYEGSEVIKGIVDEPEDIVEQMVEVLEQGIKETMQRSYTVKINDYSVNLASAEDVIKLLEASVNKYDTESEYGVELTLDSDRELNVLAANVYDTEEAETTVEEQYNAGAGLESALNSMFDAVEPETEMDFSDYELGLINLYFSDKVEVVEAYLPTEELTSLEDAIEFVTKDQEKNQIYVVVSGDSLSKIASEHDLTTDKLMELNGITDINATIRVGDELIITVPEPELSVVHVEQTYYEETYDADVIYVDNDEWYTTQTQVLQEPSSGYHKVIADITYKNNTEISREILKEEVVMEPVAKVVERGTITPPTYIKPLSGGTMTSGFGYRTAPTKGASSYHKGVDWSTPIGTSIFASSGGTVVKAGWASGYGYVVYIDHPDGRQTRYGHLSKILVKVGQYVAQGEKIALSGNSGVSTGPHVHFEILINGVQVNPLNYIDY